MERYLEAGVIIGTFSFKGEVKIKNFCDSVEFFRNFRELYLDCGGKYKIEIYNIRESGGVIAASLSGIDSEEKALALKGKILYFDKNDVTLEDGRFFFSDMVGLEVTDFSDGKKYGSVTEIFNNGAYDIFVVETENGDVLVPNIAVFVKSVDLLHGIKITPIPGMFNE